MLLPFQQRVVDEQKALTEKRELLDHFIKTNPHWVGLPADEQERMLRQYSIMVAYEKVLLDRIAHFS